MRPKIILHVGCEKTGSTSIQNALAASYQDLSRSGILFPQSIGSPTHIQLTACVLGDYPKHPIRRQLGLRDEEQFLDFVTGVKSRLAQEIASVKPHTIIISDEHVNAHLVDKDLLGRYRSLCESFGDIHRVLIYLRRQDELRLGMFSQAVKNGAVKNIDISNPLPMLQHIPYRLNYLSILDNLSGAFGRDKLLPRIYDRNAFLGGDVVSDFSRAASIQDISAKNLASDQKNRSIDASILVRLASISRFLGRFDTERSRSLRARTISVCEKVFTGPGAVMRDEDHDRFMSQFAEINFSIKKKYFNRVGDSENLFPDRVHRQLRDTKSYPECTLSWPDFLVKLLIGGLGKW